MKQYITLWIDVKYIQPNDICTGSPISETGIDFSDLFWKDENESNFS